MAKKQSGFGEIATEAARPLAPSTVDRKRSTVDVVPWEQANKRATYYLPVEMIEAVRDGAAALDISASRFVVEAIEAKLDLEAHKR